MTSKNMGSKVTSLKNVGSGQIFKIQYNGESVTVIAAFAGQIFIGFVPLAIYFTGLAVS